MIDRSHELPVSRQVKLLAIGLGMTYYRLAPVPLRDLALMRRIDELHLKMPTAGSRMLRDLLRLDGHVVGRRHIATLIKRMGIEAIYCGSRTSAPHPGHRVFAYLLREVSIERPNQVWAFDTTYIPMAQGFVYLTAVIDAASRAVLAHRVATTLEAYHAREVFEDALACYGAPEIVNTD